MLRIETSNRWSEDFFTHFYKLKNELHQGIENFLSENLEDYSKFFSPSSPFQESYQWQAFLVFKDDLVVAKAVLCWKTGHHSGNLGFIDWREDFEVAEFLWGAVNEFARSKNISEIKTPVDFNFFVNFRVRLPNQNAPIYGEPTYPDYYHEFFEKLGFDVVGRWDVFEALKWKTILNFRKQRKHLSKKEMTSSGKLKIRPLKLDQWDQEMELLHKLFSEAYKVMPDFEPITLAQFRLLFDKFKYIASSRISFIAELDGHPVGFGINYPDPQKVLKSIHGKELNLFQKVIALLRLKFNFGNLIIAHVGRVPGPNGEEIKGLQAQISKHLSKRAIWMKRAFLIQRSDALSKRAWGEGNQRLYANYVLYGKKLK